MLFVAFGFVKLVVEGVAEKGVSDFNRMLALAIVAASVIAYFRIGFPEGVKRAALAEPETQRNLLNFLFAIFAVISAVIGLMAPRAAVESRAGIFEIMLGFILSNTQETRANTEVILDRQEDIAKAVGAGEASLALRSIGGDGVGEKKAVPRHTGLW